MRWLRICIELLAVLATMRMGSWTVGWIAARLTPATAKWIVVAANIFAFGVFTLIILQDRMPGEPIDVQALLFGLAVFLLYCWIDLHWTPWKLKREN